MSFSDARLPRSPCGYTRHMHPIQTKWGFGPTQTSSWGEREDATTSGACRFAKKGETVFSLRVRCKILSEIWLPDVEVSLLPAQPALIFYLQGRILVFSGAPASSLPSNVHNPKTHSPALNPISLWQRTTMTLWSNIRCSDHSIWQHDRWMDR